jgi:hypothetical protein
MRSAGSSGVGVVPMMMLMLMLLDCVYLAPGAEWGPCVPLGN